MSKHGGSRPVVRDDDKRIIRKVNNSERVTILIEKEHLFIMRKKYGRNWQDVVRSLIETHLQD